MRNVTASYNMYPGFVSHSQHLKVTALNDDPLRWGDKTASHRDFHPTHWAEGTLQLWREMLSVRSAMTHCPRCTAPAVYSSSSRRDFSSGEASLQQSDNLLWLQASALPPTKHPSLWPNSNCSSLDKRLPPFVLPLQLTPFSISTAPFFPPSSFILFAAKNLMTLLS